MKCESEQLLVLHSLPLSCRDLLVIMFHFLIINQGLPVGQAIKDRRFKDDEPEAPTFQTRKLSGCLTGLLKTRLQNTATKTLSFCS